MSSGLSGAFLGTRRPQAPDETRQRQPRSSPDSLLFGSDPDAKLVFSCHNWYPVFACTNLPYYLIS